MVEQIKFFQVKKVGRAIVASLGLILLFRATLVESLADAEDTADVTSTNTSRNIKYT